MASAYRDPNYQNNYRKSKTGSKSRNTCQWKYKGLKGDYDAVFERWWNATECELCNVTLTTSTQGNARKVMDHDHLSGHFRNVICVRCNNYLQRIDLLRVKLCLEIHRYHLVRQLQ